MKPLLYLWSFLIEQEKINKIKQERRKKIKEKDKREKGREGRKKEREGKGKIKKGKGKINIHFSGEEWRVE